MPSKPKNIDDYISQFPVEIQKRLELLRSTIKNAAPACVESIRYNMPAFKLNDQHIYFAAYKKHIGMYPTYGMPNLEKQLEAYRGKDTKDSIHFLHSQDIPYDLVTAIVKAKLKISKK